MISAVNGVRSRITQTTSNGASRATSASVSETWSLKKVSSADAAGFEGLDNLTAIVDRNRLQQGGRTEETKRLEPLADKWRSFGFEVREIDGHDFDQLLAAIGTRGTDRPVCVIANTTKGKGVSFMEDRAEWHHKVPSAEQVQTAREELSR